MVYTVVFKTIEALVKDATKELLQPFYILYFPSIQSVRVLLHYAIQFAIAKYSHSHCFLTMAYIYKEWNPFNLLPN